MDKNVNAPENLKVKVSKFKSPLTFNEWAEQLRVSSQYTEHRPLFQGNPSCGIKSHIPEPTFWDDLKRLFLIKY
jgi:hypothetical protein